jgi:hypothetical protein
MLLQNLFGSVRSAAEEMERWDIPVNRRYRTTMTTFPGVAPSANIGNISGDPKEKVWLD